MRFLSFIHVEDDSSWKQVQPFSWRCRSTDDSEYAQNERAEFLKSEGWVAVNSRMGTPNELEYKILIAGDTLKIAVNFIEISKQDSKNPWPIGLDDDVIIPTPGRYPLEMFFNPSNWGVVRFGEN